MTPRERLSSTIRHEEPDRVPCSPWSCILFPSKVLGIKLGDLSGALATYPFWKAQLRSDKKFGFDSRILSPLCLGGGEYIPVRESEEVKVNKEIIRRKGVKRWVRITIKTPAGDLTEERCCPEDAVDWGVKPLIDDPERDYKKIRCLLGDPSSMDFTEHQKAQEIIGDQGLLMLGFDTPWTWWIIRRGEAGFTDPFDYSRTLGRFCEDYLDFVRKYIGVCDTLQPDLYWIHGVYDGIAGPRLLDRYVFPFIKEIRKLTSTPLQYFLSGNCMELLEKVADTGIDILEPLEPFPLGDVDLAEVKRKIGDRVCLAGNLDPINVVERGTPQDVEREVRKCIGDAAEGSGYIFATADQITNITSVENVRCMLEAVKKYGRYR